MKKLLFALIISAFPTASFSEGASYVCLTELSTGFKIDGSGKKWRTASFFANDRFLVRPLRPEDIGYISAPGVEPYGVFKFGNKYAVATCPQGFSYFYGEERQASNWLNCDGLSDFKLNSETLRFVTTYTIGFTDSHPNGEQKDGNTPSISIGSCSRM